MKNRFQMQQTLVRAPATVFQRCPECESPNLMRFEGEVICEYCGWDSISLHLEARLSAQNYQQIDRKSPSTDREPNVA